MFGFVPARLKVLVPGYRERLYRRHAALIDVIQQHIQNLSFGCEDGKMFVVDREQNVKLYGFATEPSNAELFDIVRPALPASLDREYFRLAKDYVTRWLYPHMRPDLALEGYTVDQLHGLHGQHKDTIHNISDPGSRNRLMRAFQPGREDVLIDCGAFLGFGSIRMARDVPGGRVIAVEASGDCHALLKRNVDSNGATNVTPLHRGVWNAESEITLEKTYAQGNSLVTEVLQGDDFETVKTITIDEIVTAQGLQRVDMLSLTLNGAEVEALQGATKTLSELRPRIRAAGWYSRGNRRIAEILRSELAPYNYDVFVGPRNNFMALPKEC